MNALTLINPTDAVSVMRSWSDLDDAALKRRATVAAANRDLKALTSLTVAHATLTSRGREGAWAPHTIRSYERGISDLLTAWQGENLLRPTRDAGPALIARLTASGLSPSTVSVRLAAARALYRALRWSGATTEHPFADVRVPTDPTPRWDKREPYSDDDVTRLLAAANGRPERAVVVLLGAHAGLRASEMVALEWGDVNLSGQRLIVRHGKGGKAGAVNLSPALTNALLGMRDHPRPLGNIATYDAVVYAMRRLCHLSGVKHRGVHALRHTCGTRIYRETHDLNDAARHLRHAQIETAAVYAKWSDQTVRSTVAGWTA